MLRKEFVVVPACEAALIFVVALAAWLTHRPLLFASLGPTAFELVETPERQTARPYNIIVGHLLGVISGFIALYATHAWTVPGASTGDVTMPRVAAAVLAALLTVCATMLARAGQPAAISTALLIALGIMQRWQDAFYIMAAVILLTLIGEPLRRWREKTTTTRRSPKRTSPQSAD